MPFLVLSVHAIKKDTLSGLCNSRFKKVEDGKDSEEETISVELFGWM